jgi:hypothetical protein
MRLVLLVILFGVLAWDRTTPNMISGEIDDFGQQLGLW